MITPVPAGFVRMGDGRVVPAQTSFGAPKQKPRKFLVVLQFYAGDRDAAEQLASLIADLERTRNHEADILLFRRADSPELSPQIVAKLQSKFDRVLVQACRRIDAKGYPMGPNQMWSDLLMLMSQVVPYRNDYYAFVNLETDVTPTGPGWIPTIIAAWKSAMAEGKPIIGHFCTDPFVHLNGMAVYSADVYRRAGGNVLAGGSPQVCFDIRHHPTLFPMAKESPVIFFKYRQATITPDELFAVRRNGIAPALYHGVKDGSARAAVRARHISFTDKPAPVIAATAVSDHTNFTAIKEGSQIPILELAPGQTIEPVQPFGDIFNVIAENKVAPSESTKRPNVYTYYSARGRQSNESQATIELWKKGWASRGWNPIVLTFRDSAKHPKFDLFSTAIEKLPCAMDRHRTAHRFNRWLALELAGGGLLVDCDVLPADFTPTQLGDVASAHVFRAAPQGRFFGAYFDQEAATKWIDAIMAYDAQPDDMFGVKPDVTDDTILRRFHPKDDPPDGLIHFSSSVVGNERKSVAMERFLAGVTA